MQSGQSTSKTENFVGKAMPHDLRLENGARIGVVGGGPAGAFFSILLLETARKEGLDLLVEIYEPRDFSDSGPAGCNMCGGIISETLIQSLSTRGIRLPENVVQQDIDSYMLHMDVGSVKIRAPNPVKQIEAVYRGSGPRNVFGIKQASFDAYLLKLAQESGAAVINLRVDEILFQDGCPQLKTHGAAPRTYDLVVVASGVNSAFSKLLGKLDLHYQAPQTTRTFIHEFQLGKQVIETYLGTSMHVFLLDIPRLEFAAVIPKGDYASVCLLGEDIDKALVDNFFKAPEVVKCFPPGMKFKQMSCACAPRINVGGASNPFADRIVFIGDCGVTRLYKDGIGAAYRTAKSAAETVVLKGISAQAFEKYYLPTCQEIESDNKVGRWLFTATRQTQRHRTLRQALLQITSREQKQAAPRPAMSMVLWDMFTGSAPYTDILKRIIRPRFLVHYFSGLVSTLIGRE